MIASLIGDGLVVALIAYVMGVEELEERFGRNVLRVLWLGLVVAILAQKAWSH